MTTDERNLLLLVACYVHEMQLKTFTDISAHVRSNSELEEMKQQQQACDLLYAAIRKVQVQQERDNARKEIYNG